MRHRNREAAARALKCILADGLDNGAGYCGLERVEQASNGGLVNGMSDLSGILPVVLILAAPYLWESFRNR